MEYLDKSTDGDILKKSKEKKSKTKHIDEEIIGEDILHKSKKKKRKHGDQEISVSPVMIGTTVNSGDDRTDYEDGDISDKPKKKKGKCGDQEISVPPGIIDVTVNSDEDVLKSKKKKRKHIKEEITDRGILNEAKSKKRKHGDQEISETPAMADHLTTSGKHKKSKKKDKSVDVKEAIWFSTKSDKMVLAYDGEGRNGDIIKKKKKKQETNEGKIVEAPLNGTDTDCSAFDNDEHQAKRKKKKKVKSDAWKEETNLLTTKSDNVVAANDSEGDPTRSEKREEVSVAEKPVGLETIGEMKETILTLPDLDNLPPESELMKINLSLLPLEPICPYCNQVFAAAKYRTDHVATVHFKIKPYECDVCSLRFGRHSTLAVHKRVHTGEMNYGCRYCEKVFRNCSNLYKHQSIHAKEGICDLRSNPEMMRLLHNLGQKKPDGLEFKLDSVKAEAEEELEDDGVAGSTV